MKLKITSNGTIAGTHVVDAETGEELEGVTYVIFCSDADTGETYADFRVADVAVEATDVLRIRDEGRIDDGSQ